MFLTWIYITLETGVVEEAMPLLFKCILLYHLGYGHIDIEV